MLPWRTCVEAMAIAGLIALVAAAAPAAADPAAPRRRVLLTDPDPELRHAMEQTLAPWQLEVVIERTPPANAVEAKQRADADTSRFVVWRDAKHLVVYDRELDATEQRDSTPGQLDAVSAAAAALTIKTMMRLPPPPAPDAPEVHDVHDVHDAAPPAPQPPPSRLDLRLEAGIAVRIASGIDSITSTRFAGAAMIQPWPSAGLLLGIAVDAGPGTTVDNASFHGTWSDWTAAGEVGWRFVHGELAIEPRAGFGVRRSTLDGTEVKTPRSEAAALATARAGLAIGWYHAHWTIGAEVDVDATMSAPTYNKTQGAAEIFEVPGSSIAIGAVAAAEL